MNYNMINLSFKINYENNYSTNLQKHTLDIQYEYSDTNYHK